VHAVHERLPLSQPAVVGTASAAAAVLRAVTNSSAVPPNTHTHTTQVHPKRLSLAVAGTPLLSGSLEDVGAIKVDGALWARSGAAPLAV
jgi:hypothetical protein